LIKYSASTPNTIVITFEILCDFAVKKSESTQRHSFTMKTICYKLSTIAAIIINAQSVAQSITCDQLSITSIEPDTFNVNNTLINIQFTGEAMDFINYPFIPAVWDCNGDTVATGEIFFFGQLGQTTQGYPVSFMSADVCLPITLQFVYGDAQLVNDTCLLTYGSGLYLETIEEDNITVFPNPTASNLQLNITERFIGQPYTLCDATGHVLQTGRFQCMTTPLSLESLPAGAYVLQIGRDFSYTRRIIKE